MCVFEAEDLSNAHIYNSAHHIISIENLVDQLENLINVQIPTAQIFAF